MRCLSSVGVVAVAAVAIVVVVGAEAVGDATQQQIFNAADDRRLMWIDGHVSDFSSASDAAGSGSGRASGEDEHALTLMARYSGAAYCRRDALVDWTCALCSGLDMRAARPFISDADLAVCGGRTGMQGYTGVSDALDAVIVAFRGSHNLLNFLNDLALAQTDLRLPHAPPDVLVHAGFWNAWDSVRDVVVRRVSELLKETVNGTVAITGHSLGGAVAVLAATDLIASGVVSAANIQVYTYGEPRVGNHAFQTYMSSLKLRSLMRAVHYNDIVPHNPPLEMSFRHHGTEYWIDADHHLVICDDAENDGEDTNCMATVSPWVSYINHLFYLGTTMGAVC